MQNPQPLQFSGFISIRDDIENVLSRERDLNKDGPDYESASNQVNILQLKKQPAPGQSQLQSFFNIGLSSTVR